MNSVQGGMSSIKLQTILACLEKRFVDVQFSQKQRPTFTFHNSVGNVSWHLVVNEGFLADRMSLEEVRGFIEKKVIPKIFQHPGKRIQISKYWDVTVEEKTPA